MNEYRNLVICNNCLWAASLLKGSNGFKISPMQYLAHPKLQLWDL